MEIDENSNISSEDTEILENTSKDIIQRKFDWTERYGELEAGEYEFVLGDDDSIGIKIYFSVDFEGNVLYGESEYLY